MARTEAAIGIAVGIVALTGVAALAVGNDGDSTDNTFPPGHSRAEWAHGDHEGPPPWAGGRDKGDRDKGDRDKGDRGWGRHHHGPPPWANGHRPDKDKRHGPPPWAHDGDKGDKGDKGAGSKG